MREAIAKKLLEQLRIFPYSISSSRGRSSAGRALDWQSRGQGFDSPRLHHRECKGHSFEWPFYLQSLLIPIWEETSNGDVSKLSD